MSLFIDEIIEENAKLKEKIEDLKEDLQIAKDNYKSLEWHNNNQYQLLNKYKKVIKILKNDLGIHLDEDWLISNEVMVLLNDEEKKLFKEVLGND